MECAPGDSALVQLIFTNGAENIYEVKGYDLTAKIHSKLSALLKISS